MNLQIVKIMKTNNNRFRYPFVVANFTNVFVKSILLIAGSLVLQLTNRAAAQTERTVALSQLSSSIAYPTGTFDTGDSVTLVLRVSRGNTNIDSVVSMQLELHLNAEAATPDLNHIDLSGSWLGQSTSLTDTSTVDVPHHVLHLNAYRTDGTFISGRGEIARVTLICNADGVAAQDLVKKFDGGIGVIDNVDMKVAPNREPAIRFRAYPNPVVSRLNLEGLQSEEAFTIFSTSGQVVHRGTADPQGKQSLKLEHLSGGMYLLRTATGQYQRLLVI